MGSVLALFEKQTENASQSIPIRHRPTTLESVFAEELDIEAGKNMGQPTADGTISVVDGQN